MTKKEMYREVLKDLSNIPILTGKFDAINGTSEYMFGIRLVMEIIASESGEYEFNSFLKEFDKNFIESYEKVGKSIDDLMI